LKFGTLKGRIRVHLDTKFGCNKWSQSYNQLFAKNNTNTLSCLQGLTANGKELKIGMVTIEPQTFGYFKEIELKITKIQ